MTKKLLPENKSWTREYSAIDGIVRYDEELKSRPIIKEGVRSDLVKILNMNKGDFNKWLGERITATKNLKDQYELFSSIPNLHYGSDINQFDMTSITSVEENLESLSKGLDYLSKIREAYEIANR